MVNTDEDDVTKVIQKSFKNENDVIKNKKKERLFVDSLHLLCLHLHAKILAKS